MPDSITARPTPWRTVVLLCGKCSRKLEGGFGEKGAEKLRTALKTELRERGQRRSVRVVETKCFGLCPKRAVVAMNASAPEQLLTIPAGTATGAVLRALAPDTVA